MNWKTVGLGFKHLTALILIPCSWLILISEFGTAFGPVGYILSFLGLFAFTVFHFAFEYQFKE